MMVPNTNGVNVACSALNNRLVYWRLFSVGVMGGKPIIKSNKADLCLS